jgi:hypothetical protein
VADEQSELEKLREENQRLRHTLGMPLAPQTENYDWGEAAIRELARAGRIDPTVHEALTATLKEIDYGRRRHVSERGRLQAVAHRLGAPDVYSIDEFIRKLQPGTMDAGVVGGKSDLPRQDDNHCLDDQLHRYTVQPVESAPGEATAYVDTDDGRKHLVAACFDYAERYKDEGNVGFACHILFLHAARYIQHQEDELHRYQVQPVDNTLAVVGEEPDRWDEDEARKLAYKTEHESIHEILELAEHLGHALTVLDANRIWRVAANKETTRLGQWNLKLRDAAQKAYDLLSMRYVEKQLHGEVAEELGPLQRRLKAALSPS